MTPGNPLCGDFTISVPTSFTSKTTASIDSIGTTVYNDIAWTFVNNGNLCKDDAFYYENLQPQATFKECYTQAKGQSGPKCTYFLYGEFIGVPN